MTPVKTFSPFAVPLTGTQLVAASAGTGKTHTITDLFLRLILEGRDIQVDRILVVTFTDAAAEELRLRIRKRLREAIKVFTGGQGSPDPVLAEIVKNRSDPDSALRKLTCSVSNFDEAAIYTIHGFCRRLLRDQAYENGTLFDTDLITSQDSLIQETVDDFWRHHFYNAPGSFVSYALSSGFSPEALLKIVNRYIHNSPMKIIPDSILPDTRDAEQKFQQAFRKVASEWPVSKKEVAKILLNHESLKKNIYRTAVVESLLDELDKYLAARRPVAFLPDKFIKLTSKAIAESTKKNMPLPQHSFFELFGDFHESNLSLCSLYDRVLHGLKVSLFDYVGKELALKKFTQKVQYFDDLLINVSTSLRGKGGEMLARNVRTRLKVALIDEFQDTDPIQYEIFRRIFDHKDAALFLIGDPKQAIYSFRSADIFAYMKAADSVKTQHTIEINWRSDPELLQAVNTLFLQHKNPFLYDQIPFIKTTPAAAPKKELRINGKKEPPLHLWFVRCDKKAHRSAQINKRDISLRIANAVANETARLLNQIGADEIRIGNRPLATGDIAVLVRTHSQARLIRQELSRRSVPCILHSSGFLFESDEAVEIERILAAIARPHDERLVRAALTTDIMGASAEGLYELSAHDTKWGNRLIAFRDYHDMWNNEGFFRMFRRFMLQEQVKGRLISLPDGERRLTNLLHLSEELHKQSAGRNLGMQGLTKWLSVQMHPDTPKAEEHLLRLESDEDAVKIVTIHKSKGLEYPVVFCPFTWESSKVKGNEILFHDRDDKLQLTLDLGSPDRDVHREYAAEETLAENMRLLYVALSRAMNRCYLIWGGFKDADTSAPAYLFHNHIPKDGRGIVQQTAELFMGLSDDDICKTMKDYENLSGGAIIVREVSEETPLYYSLKPVGGPAKLNHRIFQGAVAQQWRVASFSSLASNYLHEPEHHDSDEFALYSEEVPQQQDLPAEIFSLPAGTKTGSMLHDILEHLDFADTDTPSLKKLISEKLTSYGFDLLWQTAVYSMIQNVLSVPLKSHDSDFTLSDIQSKDKVSELGFCFPLQTISKERLQNIFSEFGGRELIEKFPDVMGALTFSPVEGFMKGYIDLVFQYNRRFYLVDWKSNLLGTTPEDYQHKNLLAVMERDLYILQYHLYTLALHQYLSVQIPNYSYEKHFGGVYYIFLRGVDPARGPQHGIYRDRPPEKLIEEMRKQLIKTD